MLNKSFSQQNSGTAGRFSPSCCASTTSVQVFAGGFEVSSELHGLAALLTAAGAGSAPDGCALTQNL